MSGPATRRSTTTEMSCLYCFLSVGGSDELDLLAVDEGAGVAARGQLLEEVDELALLLRDDRADDHVAGARLELHQLVGDLLHRLALDALAADRAVRHADARPQQAHVVVDLGDRADRRARVAVGRLLVDRHRRAQALDEVDVGPVDLAEELARVGGQRLDVAALALGEDGVERERRLARSGQAREDDQRVARDLEVDVVQVVHARAAHAQVRPRHPADVPGCHAPGLAVLSIVVHSPAAHSLYSPPSML